MRTKVHPGTRAWTNNQRSITSKSDASIRVCIVVPPPKINLPSNLLDDGRKTYLQP